VDNASPLNLPFHVRRPDRNRPEPLWHQTESAHLPLIAYGARHDGAQLPNEAKLSDMLGVSRITMRHALRNMEEWRLLRRERGRGAFVRSSMVIAGACGPTSLTQEMAERGLSAGSRMLELSEIPADYAIDSALEIREGAAVVKLRRLRFGVGQPIGIQTAYLPAKRARGLAGAGKPLVSLYATQATSSASSRSRRSRSTVSATCRRKTRIFSSAAGSPAFIVQRTASDVRGSYGFTVSTMRGDSYEIRSRLRM
jgi:GntR family transcriptional regulator